MSDDQITASESRIRRDIERAVFTLLFGTFVTGGLVVGLVTDHWSWSLPFLIVVAFTLYRLALIGPSDRVTAPASTEDAQ